MKNIFTENVAIALKEKNNVSLQFLFEDQFDVFKDEKDEEDNTPSDADQTAEPSDTQPEPEASDSTEPVLPGDTDSTEPVAPGETSQFEVEQKKSPREKIEDLEDKTERAIAKITDKLLDIQEEPIKNKKLSSLRNGLKKESKSINLSLKNILLERKTLSDQIDVLEKNVEKLDNINDQLNSKLEKFTLSFENRETFLDNVRNLAADFNEGRIDLVEMISDQIRLQIKEIFEGSTGYDLEDFTEECVLLFSREVGAEDSGDYAARNDHIESVGAISSAS